MPWIEMPGRPPAPQVQARAGQAQPWYSVKNAAADEAELLLFDEIGGWWGTTAAEVIEELKAITAPRLRVKINSPGGSVFEGVALANALRAHPAEVVVQVEGLAASIASVIALAGDKLIVQPNAMIMIHDASGLCMGDSSEMSKMAELLDAISDNIASAYAAKAGGTAAEWRQAMKQETWYSAEQAVEAGLADEVGKQRGQKTPDGDDPEMRKAFDLKAYGYAGPGKPRQDDAASLTIDIGSALGEQIVAAVREAVAGTAPQTPAVDDTAARLEDGGGDADDKAGGGVVGEQRVERLVADLARALKAYEEAGEQPAGEAPDASGGEAAGPVPDAPPGEAEPPADDPPPLPPETPPDNGSGRPEVEPDTPEVPGSSHDQPDPADETPDAPEAEDAGTDAWASAVAHLTTPAPSSGADDHFSRLIKEGLL